MMNSSSSFIDAILNAELSPPGHIAPGRVHRFPGAGKKSSNTSGWCLLFPDGRAGVFGDWSTGLREVWKEGNERLSLEEIAAVRQAMKEAQKAFQEERNRVQKHAANVAWRKWNSAEPAMFHPYLKQKKILPFGTRTFGKYLLVPVYCDDVITSIQFISPTGDKRFLKHGRIAKGYFPIGEPKDVIYICEGFATAASLHMATREAVAVAFNANNLKPVAQFLKAKHPEKNFIIAGDNDINTEGNPGLAKAREAAASIGAKVIYPDFSDEDFEGTDFNDYIRQGGRL